MEGFITRQVLFVVIPVVLAGILIVFAVVSAFLHYHWSRYEISREHAFAVQWLYFSIAGIFFALMFVSAIFYLV